MTLKKAAMAFQLEDGNIIWISKEDCNQISTAIICEGMVNRSINVKFVKDSNTLRAQTLIDLIASERSMDTELKKSYLEKILELLSSPGEPIEEDFYEAMDKSTPEERLAETTTYQGRGRPRKNI